MEHVSFTRGSGGKFTSKEVIRSFLVGAEPPLLVMGHFVLVLFLLVFIAIIHTQVFPFHLIKGFLQISYNFYYFVPVQTYTQIFVFGNFGVLCFLEISVLRFALLPYYRQYFTFLAGLTETGTGENLAD